MADYPIQFGQPFYPGQAMSPVITLDAVEVDTQTNIMCRWPDNSVKFAIFSIVVTGSVDDEIEIGFIEGTPLGTTPGTLVSFDAAIEISGIQVLKSTLAAAPYITGPLASTYIHADHTGAHDIQPIDSNSAPIRPIFHVTHWHTLSNARVRFIGENTKISAMGQSLCPLRLLIDAVEVYSNLTRPWFEQMMSYASRWTRVFWVDTAPSEPQILQHDVEYFASTGASHNYDHTVAVTEAAVESMYTTWTNVKLGENDDVFKAGLWTKAMGNAGGSDYVGPWTTWIMLLFYTGDYRMREVCEGQANQGCQWPMHYRETNGTFYSVETHPSCQLLNISQNAARSGVTPVSDFDSWAWNPDTSHQPDHFFPLYLMTGEFFHYEEAAFWASWSCAFYNHAGVTAEFGCGPTGTEGGIPGLNSLTIRGQAWTFRSRCEVASFGPDNRLEKPYFFRMVEDAIQIWEGERAISTTVNNNTANWLWGRSITPSNHPLRFWQHGNSAFIINQNGSPNGDVDPSKASAGLSTWEQNFLCLALIRGQELGFATTALITWITPNIQGQQENLDWKIASNRSPTFNPSGQFFTTWQQVEACYPDAWAASQGYTYQGRFTEKLADLNHGYTVIALAVGKALNCLSNFMIANATPNFTSNPKWAILTRTTQPVPPTLPPDPPVPPEPPDPPPEPPIPPEPPVPPVPTDLIQSVGSGLMIGGRIGSL